MPQHSDVTLQRNIIAILLCEALKHLPFNLCDYILQSGYPLVMEENN